jgi:predicted RNA-binding Zn ribbon-like protein
MLGSAALTLLNSAPPGRPDLLDEPGWLAAAVRGWDIEPEAPITAADLEVLRDVRTLLRALTGVVVTGELLSGELLARFNAVLAISPVQARLATDSGRYVFFMTPVAAHWRDRAVREIAGSFAAVLRADPTRLRVCHRPGCGTVFWDETRSRTRVWCDSRTCGNRERVRRHRVSSS